MDQDGNLIKEFKREVLNKAEFPEQYWNEVIAGMNTQGLRAFEDFKYDFARKTGTSEQDIYKTVLGSGWKTGCSSPLLHGKIQSWPSPWSYLKPASVPRVPRRLPVKFSTRMTRFTAWTVRLTLKTEGENGDGSNE